MRIGLVLDDTLDTPDGVQQYVLNVGQWLSEQGHEVHYLVGRTTRTDIANVHSLSRNLKVRFNGNRMSMPLPTSKKSLKQFLATHTFDILHVQVPYSPFMAGQLLKVTPMYTAVVGTFHILPYSALVRAANRGLAVLNARSGRRFDARIAVSEPARKFAEQVYCYPAMTVVPNPVRLTQFENVNSLDIAAKPLNIVFLGRLVERKGAQHLLEAVAYLRQEKLFTGNFKVKIGGKGELLSSLKTYVKDHELSEVVKFAGFIDEAAKPGFLAQADIAVFPSTSGESFGIVLLEAMAAARGVVLGANNPGYTSVLGPLSPNQLFSAQDTPAFAQKLVDYLANASARTAAAHQQKQYVQQFDIAVVGEQLVEIYSKALQSRSHS